MSAYLVSLQRIQCWMEGKLNTSGTQLNSVHPFTYRSESTVIPPPPQYYFEYTVYPLSKLVEK